MSQGECCEISKGFYFIYSIVYGKQDIGVLSRLVLLQPSSC